MFNQSSGGRVNFTVRFRELQERVMKKIYRSPKVAEGQIKFQRGKVDGDIDMCIFYGDNTPRCDRALVMNIFSAERLTWDRKSTPSFIDDLEVRGYDLDTLKFSIEKKVE